FSKSRVYSPTIGEWMSVDQLVQSAAADLLSAPGNWRGVEYASGDPVNLVDPSGLETQGVGLTLSGGFGMGGDLSFGVVWDDKGNIGLMGDIGFGSELTKSPGVSLTLDSSHSFDATDIYTLQGSSASVGGSGFTPSLLGGGGEIAFGSGYKQTTMSVGVGVPGGGAFNRVHVSDVIGFNIKETFNEIKNAVGTWFSSSLNIDSNKNKKNR
ncbi:MAG: hypothetical protein HQK50_19260, partial [Oligoflexia bacterium]|nr:hypothetical protein [Oligoflexia bacterium]